MPGTISATSARSQTTGTLSPSSISQSPGTPIAQMVPKRPSTSRGTDPSTFAFACLSERGPLEKKTNAGIPKAVTKEESTLVATFKLKTQSSKHSLEDIASVEHVTEIHS